MFVTDRELFDAE